MLAVILALEALALNPSKAFAPAKTHASKPQLSCLATDEHGHFVLGSQLGEFRLFDGPETGESTEGSFGYREREPGAMARGKFRRPRKERGWSHLRS